MSLVNLGAVNFNPSMTTTYTFGVGPENVRDIFGPTILDGGTYYTLYLSES